MTDDPSGYSAGGPQPGAPQPEGGDRRRRGLVWWLLGGLAVVIAIVLAAVSCSSTPTPTPTGQGSATTSASAAPVTTASAVVPPPLTPTTSVVPPPLTPTTGVVPPPLTPTSTPGTGTTPQVAVPNGVNAGSGGQAATSAPVNGMALLLLLSGVALVTAGSAAVRRSR